jgi:hypothetical protein
MNDPEEAHDTDPTGRPVASGEDTGLQDDAVTERNDPSPEAFEDGSSEHDTGGFLQWLPTMWLGYRRRKELVHRPSSDGADFAAYACAGRPVAASVPSRPEAAAVQVQTASRPESRASAEARERDAPTVVKPRRIRRPRAGLVAWGAVGLVAASAAIAGWAHRPLTTERVPTGGAAVTPPMPIAPGLVARAEPLESPPLPPAAGLQGGVATSSTNLPKTPMGQRGAPSKTSMKESMARRETAGAPAAGTDASARNRAAPLAASSALPAKEQYFEAQ